MKREIYILVLGLMLSACTNSEHTGMTISVLEDVTEPDFVARPNAEVVCTNFGLDDNPWQSATFRYGTVSSLVHNRRSELRLEGGTALMGNQLERDVEITKLHAGIDTILTASKDCEVHQFSSIWEPIVEELEYLQKDLQHQSTLYVFSDLQENSKWFSIHRYDDWKLLKTTPDKVKDLFLKQATSINRNNSNIKVVVVYQPANLKQDEIFSMLSALYSAVFNELGIQIEFTTNLNSI